jgi:hypothetical protein
MKEALFKKFTQVSFKLKTRRRGNKLHEKNNRRPGNNNDNGDNDKDEEDDDDGETGL